MSDAHKNVEDQTSDGPTQLSSAFSALRTAGRKHAPVAGVTSIGGLAGLLIYAFNLLSDANTRVIKLEENQKAMAQQLKAHMAHDWTPKQMARWTSQARELNFGKGITWPDPLIVSKEMRDDDQ